MIRKHSGKYLLFSSVQNHKRHLFYSILLVTPIPAFIISLFMGTYSHLTPDIIIGILVSRITGTESVHPIMYESVLFNMRIPRICMTMLVGAALSISGAAFQGVFRNPLVSPDILGLASGAAFGAALSMCIIPGLPTAPVAFLFSFLALTFAWSMARTKGETSVVNLVLAGVMTSAIFSSLLALIQFAVDSKALQSIVFWMMGSLNTACWSKVNLIIFPIILGTGVMLLMRWRLNALSMSEEEARALGVHPERYKLLFIIAGTLATSAAVSVAGIIGLVGLIVPHVVRMILGPDHRMLLPASLTFGASFLVIVDDFARSLFSFEIPIGILTTLIGAPFFLYLLRKSGTGGWS